MPNIILVGAQWGDEGKGKIIDLLTEKSDIIVRFQGGNNAGHTVRFEDQKFVLHLIPSGILHPGKICLLGNGVVVDPDALFEEIATLESKGIRTRHRVFVSDQAHLIFPYHKQLDRLHEEAKGAQKIGTTQRGIGPCYADKVSRTGIRIADLQDPATLRKRLSGVVAEKNRLLFRMYGVRGASCKALLQSVARYRARLLAIAQNTALFLNQAIRRHKRILFEGAQGTLLDVDHGTYPYVTSSNTSAGAALTGTGIGPTAIDEVIGVVKAYTTRVGEGPFPTEFRKLLMEKIRDVGEEYGATTGRPRRCGWFDAVIARHAVLVNGLSKIAVMKLDVLDSLPEIKICVAYLDRGRRLTAFPSNVQTLSHVKPVYETHPGWRTPTSHARRLQDLPVKARAYLKRLERILAVPISIISVGSKRNQTIFV